MSFWSGSFTDYGTALGTLSLAGITTVSMFRESRDRKQLKAERDEARTRTAELEAQEAARLAERARRTNAEAVTCSIGVQTYDPQLFAPPDGSPQPGDQVECATIQNMNNRPIREVDVLWQFAGAPSEEPSKVQARGLFAVIPGPGMRAQCRPSSLAQFERNNLALTINFTDAEGIRWAKRNDGTLTEVISTV